MPHTLFLAPVGSGSGLTSISLGLFRALDNHGIRVAFYKPIGQPVGGDSGPERSTHFIRATTSLNPTDPVPLEEAERLIGTGHLDELLERIVRAFHESAGNADVVVVEGLIPHASSSYTSELNLHVARTLSAEVILCFSATETTPAEVDEKIEIAAQQFGGLGMNGVIGCIINRIPPSLLPPPERRSAKLVIDTATSCIPHAPRLTPDEIRNEWIKSSRLLQPGHCRLIGAIPQKQELTACRTIDICRYLGAQIVNEGEIFTRRAKKISLLARTVPNSMHTFIPGAILISPSDRTDTILGVAMAAINKIPMAGLVLTGENELSKPIMDLCSPAWETGLPILSVPTNSWETATYLSRMSTEVPSDDIERAQLTMEYIASHIDAGWITSHSSAPVEVRMSPAAFCFRLAELARKTLRRIVLPEGEEPRTIRAAALCAERGIAHCILLGKPETIRLVARHQEIDLPESLEIIDPESVRGKYVAPLVEMRRHKGLTPKDAEELLEDTVWLGTVMLALGEVDGLVSGALHSSANTIRPALQIIKTQPGVKAVSSIFFMCMPEQVLIYGDCAVIPNPDAETLADITIQSAESAIRFGIPARVAMISYSTGESGSGVDVEKVREAAVIAKTKRPDLLIDGPLQYDAAAIPDVAAQKAREAPWPARRRFSSSPTLIPATPPTRRFSAVPM